MLKFNQLYVNNGHLIIDVSVLSGSQYNNVYISKIIVDTQDTYIDGGSTQAYTAYEDDGVNHVTTKSINIDLNQLQQTLSNSESSLPGLSANALFFVTVTAGSTDDFAGLSTSDCGSDSTTITGMCIDLSPFYATAMAYIKDLNNTGCKDSCNKSYFIDYILKFKALELAAVTSNYTTAITLYKDLFSNASTYNKKGGCGCGH